MDPIVIAISTILGKYAIDKGATLLKEGGEAVAKAASNLFMKVITRLKADPAEAKNAERFEQNPEAFKPAIQAAVADQMTVDPNFAAELKALVDSFDHAQKSASVSIVNTGSGAVAMNGGVAAGAGGVAVGGNVNGGINMGNQVRSGGVDLTSSGGTLNITGDLVGRDRTTH